MIAVIRVSPKLPDAGIPPFFGRDKWAMVQACHKSFLAAGGTEITKIYMLDDCPPTWQKYFKDYGQVYPGSWGKKVSLYNTLEVGSQSGDDCLFLEDDYLWRPNTLQPMMAGLNNFGMVSPYDHPDAYQPNEPMQVYQLGNLIWRRCRTNTHTFAVKRDILINHFDDFHYGLHDWQMWTKLDIEGQRLYTPVISFATHLVTTKLAYNVNWEEVVKKYV